VETRVLHVDRSKPDEALLEEAAGLIRAGGLVAIPTETVYGIAVDAHNTVALDRLDAVKCRPSDKSYTVHIASRDAVWAYVDELPPLARFLMARHWPGPLTFVLDAPGGATVGLRLPDDPIACRVIELARVSVLAPSANPSGKTPATDAEGVLAYFQGQLDAVVDAGPSRLGSSSTVVRVKGLRRVRVMRKGPVTASELSAGAVHIVLIVCTGNMCRSPMAEAFFKMRLARRLGVEIRHLEREGFFVLSAGTAASTGGPASENAVAVMAERGYDLSAHHARHTSPVLLEDSDMILVMTDYHEKYVKKHLPPKMRDKVHLLHPYGVEDPIGQGIDFYRRIAGKMEERIDHFVDLFLEGVVEESRDKEARR